MYKQQAYFRNLQTSHYRVNDKKSHSSMMSKIAISVPILTLRWSRMGLMGLQSEQTSVILIKTYIFKNTANRKKTKNREKNSKIQEPCTMCSRYARLKISFVVILHIYMNTLSCSGFCELTFRYFTALWNTLRGSDLKSDPQKGKNRLRT